MTYHHVMGALNVSDKLGVTKYDIQGDPVIALLAQLNRFAGRSVKLPRCESKVLVPRAFPLVRSLTFPAANQAHNIVYLMSWCVEPGTGDSKRTERLASVSDVVGWVTENIREVTVTLAQLGDSFGYAPATVGIVERDERLAPRFPTTALLLVGVAVGAAFILKRRKS